MYAWILDTDHLAGKGETSREVGLTGPSDAPDAFIDVLEGRTKSVPGAEVFTFKMYDGDRELYYTGRMISDDSDDWEESCYGPLGDYGMPGAGCVEIRYPGHSDMDCG